MVLDNKTEFTRNTDTDFSETTADRDSNIAFDRVHTSDKSTEPNTSEQGKRKQRLYSRDSKQADTSNADTKTEKSADGSKKSEQEPSADVPFDRVTRFDRKAEKARAKADKAEQKLPHKKKIQKQRIFDEQKQKPKNCLHFEKEVKPQSDIYHRSPIRNSADTLQYAATNKIHTKIKKFQQKQRIKKQYQKAKQTEQTAKAAKKTAQNTERALRRFAAFVWRHKAVFGVILAIVLLIAWLGTVLSSCSVMLTTGANSIMVSSYFADDADIYAAENYYVSLEQELQNKINRIEHDYPGYDEYNYSMAQIGHNPYELISYLTAVYQDLTIFTQTRATRRVILYPAKP